MKNTILKIGAFVSALLLCTNAQAQEGLQINLQAMPQLTGLRNEDDRANKNFEYLSTVGTAFGIGGQYGFTEHAGLGVDLIYSIQGQRYRLNTVERYRKVEYLKIPVMFVNSVDIVENIRFIYKLGPQLDVLSVARLLDANGKTIVSDQTPAYEKLGLSAVLFAGMGINLAPRLMLDVGLRYDYGITNAENDNYPHSYTSTNGNGSPSAAGRAYTHNQTWGLSVGIRSVISHATTK